MGAATSNGHKMYAMMHTTQMPDCEIDSVQEVELIRLQSSRQLLRQHASEMQAAAVWQCHILRAAIIQELHADILPQPRPCCGPQCGS